MRFILSSGSLWSYGLDRCFALARAAGFDGIELLIDQRWDTRQVPFLQALAAGHHLPILAVHSPFLLKVPGWPADQPRRLKKAVRVAEAVRAEVVVHHLPSRIGYAWVQTRRRYFPLPLPQRPESSYTRWLEQEYGDFCRQTPVKPAIENMPAFRRFGRRWNIWRWNTPGDMIRFRRITLDTTHLGTWGLDPIAVFDQLGARVAHVHLSNFDGHEHRPPEAGSLRLDRFLAHLQQAGYDGLISLELEPEGLAAGSPDEQVVERLRASLDFCRRALTDRGHAPRQPT